MHRLHIQLPIHTRKYRQFLLVNNDIFQHKTDNLSKRKSLLIQTAWGRPHGRPRCLFDRHLHFCACAEFAEETHVVLEIVTEVVDSPLEHGDTLESHSECEAGVFPAVDA